MKRISFLMLLMTTLLAVACQGPADPNTQSEETVMKERKADNCPVWADNANIYEVNIRQYTPAGTLAAFAGHLPRLQEMEVDILWFMPIYPISKVRRKGTLGSYYAIADYTAVNPQFGTMEEFKALVKEVHQRGMKVVLDWVPNHTGWDHAWLEEHPDWYTRDSLGNVIDPIDPKTGESWGWTDVADLNYDNPEMRQAMIEEMQFWLREVGVDGFRCDVADNVPDNFWAQAIPQLREVNRELFMLAEAEHPPHRNMDGGFCASYGWAFHHMMNHIAQGKDSLASIDRWLTEDRERFGPGYHMMFLTNHDENFSKGTIQERLGPAADAMAVLCFTFTGIPLIYSGQEAALDKRLKFFEKDVIEWGEVPKQDFYKTLLDLKHRNEALWNGAAGGEPVRIHTDQDEDVYAFYREKGGAKVIVILNLSENPRDITLDSEAFIGEYTNVFANSTMTVTQDMMMKLNPWDYVVLSNK